MECLSRVGDEGRGVRWMGDEIEEGKKVDEQRELFS